MKQNYSKHEKEGKMVKAKRKQKKNLASKAILISDSILSIIMSTIYKHERNSLCCFSQPVFFIFDHILLKVNKRKQASRYNF